MQSNEEKKIKVLTKENPKRIGSRAFRQFKILMKYNGKSVAIFKEEAKKQIGLRKNWATNELRYNLQHGLIKLVN